MPDLVPIAGIAMITVLGFPFVAALAVRLARGGKGSPGGPEVDRLRDELREVRERLDAIEAADSRITELEERLDFAERVLAQHDRPKIERPNRSEAPT